jgi:hypothetical protein
MAKVHSLDHDLRADLQSHGLVMPDHAPLPPLRTGWKGTVKTALYRARFSAGRFLPDAANLLLVGSWGGMGDDLLYTAVAREWRKRTGRRVSIISAHAPLFAGNRAVDVVFPPEKNVLLAAEKSGLRWEAPTYYDAFRKTPRLQHLRHVIAMMCDALGLEGEVELRPEMFIPENEKAGLPAGSGTIAVQSSVLSARYPAYNKQWPPQRMAEVVMRLKSDHEVVQVGATDDPLLPGVVDFRGRPVRAVAALLSRCALFVGLEGFLSHLARAVDCRSVIVYGGYSSPEETGYSCNENLYTSLPCSPCWEPTACPYGRKCMDDISADDVISAVHRVLRKRRTPLETARVILPAKSGAPYLN